MYPWFKYVAKKFLEMPYFWFYVNNRRLSVYIFFNDLKLFYSNILNNFTTYLFNTEYRLGFSSLDFYY
jgi:hypothetical protein